MLKNMKISMSHTVSSERTCRLPACIFRNYHHGLHFATDNIRLSSLKFLWWAP